VDALNVSIGRGGSRGNWGKLKYKGGDKFMCVKFLKTGLFNKDCLKLEGNNDFVQVAVVLEENYEGVDALASGDILETGREFAYRL